MSFPHPQQHPRDPMRMCVATRASRPKAELVRWFVGPDQTHWPDWTGATGERFGKGQYTSRDAQAIGTAVDRRLLKGDKSVLLQRVCDAAERAFTDRLGLACRAGVLAIGQTAVRDALKKEWNDGVYMYARDAGPSGIERTRNHAQHRGAAIIELREGTILGKALGRDYVSSIWCQQSAFSQNFLQWAPSMVTLNTFVVSVEAAEKEKINTLEAPPTKD